jgi:tetratricopeptide (TPR) repeat protein
MHIRPLLLMVSLAFGISAVCQAQGLPPNAPAGQRFDFAYHVLRSADAAREQGDLRGAVILYEEAHREYEQLLNEFPNWDPAVTRFRADYCRDEQATLKRELERATPPQPVPPPSTNAPPPPPPPAPAALPAPVPIIVPTTNTPPSANALRQLAREHLHQGRASDARAALLDALRLEPDDYDSRLMIGAAQCILGQYLDALFVLEPLAQEFPSNTAVQVALSTAHLGLSQPETARDDLTRALEIEPDSSTAHYNMARVLLLLNRDDTTAAAEHYQRALQLGAEADPALDAQWPPAQTNSPAPTGASDQ